MTATTPFEGMTREEILAELARNIAQAEAIKWPLIAVSILMSVYIFFYLKSIVRDFPFIREKMKWRGSQLRKRRI